MPDRLAWLNFHHLLCFAAVVEEGGLVPAARRLGVSHPTVSEQVKRLEDHLELKLFERRGRRLQLTEQGALVYGYAAQIFGMGSSLLEAVEGRRSGKTVLARVGIDSVLAKLTVRRVLSPLLDALGDSLRLRCTEDDRERLLQLLRARQLDVVLTDASTWMAGDAISSWPLGSSPIVLFGSPALVEQLSGPFPRCLDGAPFLLPMPTTRLRRELERWLGERRLRPRVVAEIDDSGLLKALGQEGRGVFAMPEAVLDDVTRQYGVVPLGVADGLEARLFALVGPGAREHPALSVLYRTHGITEP